VESDEAFIDFKDLRHPALCLRSDFISNDVQLGNAVPRQTLLTGPSKSTLLHRFRKSMTDDTLYRRHRW
jgi:DNA mismatch repair protein MSH6